MNILLINPDAVRKPDFPPLGLLSIGTVLKKKVYQVKVLDAAAQSLTNETIIKMAKNFKHDFTTNNDDEPIVHDYLKECLKE